ncbi:MAG TPA: alpha/beta hydrolase [Sphingomicrobium sp.]|jgi:pimeloyl-ACP methyl ester carboxylesterase|nr:alpha/beta hydrolase [Sphingomicrobium sp.]
MSNPTIRLIRQPLPTGVILNVALAGPEDGPAAIFLHGFPESHRTWLKVAELLKNDVRMIIPDLRGFGQSDRPQDVAAYGTETLLADLFALADARRLDRFALVGHDWGGAIAWAAAIRGDPRLTRLAIVNSPHPAIFQRSLIEDDAQRAASQYMNAFRDPDMEKRIAAMGFPAFFEKSFAAHVDTTKLTGEDRAQYLADWRRPGALTAMFNWYRASQIVVPAIDEEAAMPAWVDHVPRINVPVRVIWGLDDKALLPVQLEGIGEVGPDVDVFPLKGVGHFAPWEAPDAVAGALLPFLAGE